MMKPDMPTLLLSLMVTSGVLAIAVLAVALRTRTHRGLLTWGIGLLFNALSYPAFGLRTVGLLKISILSANVLTALTMSLHAIAISSFQRHRANPPRFSLMYGLAVANALLAWWFMDNDYWRNLSVSATQSGLALFLLCQSFAPGLREPRVTGRWVVITGCIILVTVFAVRTGMMLGNGNWVPYFSVPMNVQIISYLAVLTVLLLNTMGFVLMQMEHALSQQQALATHDALTGVFNRAALMDALKLAGARARREQKPLAILMIDLDRFKDVNDNHGHLTGDRVLRDVAGRIADRLRGSDILARYGGEEFIAVLPDTDGEGALAVANDILREVRERPVRVEQQTIPVTVSLGVSAITPGAGEAELDFEELIARSDSAMYAAKRGGRNRIVLV